MNKYTLLHEKWQQYLLDYEQSGLSQSAWCREKEIPAHQLSYWKKKLSNVQPTITQEERTSFTSVTVVESKISDTHSEPILLTYGEVQVQFPLTVKPQWLAQFVKDVQSC